MKNLLAVFQDELFQLLGVGTGELVDDILVLYVQESGHAGDVVLDSQLLALVHVDLDDYDFIGVFGLQFIKLRGDHLARPAPRGEEIHQNQLVASSLKSAVEIGTILDDIDHL